MKVNIKFDFGDIQRALGGVEIDAECPTCKRKLKFKMQDVQSTKKITCQGCKTVIDIVLD